MLFAALIVTCIMHANLLLWPSKYFCLHVCSSLHSSQLCYRITAARRGSCAPANKQTWKALLWAGRIDFEQKLAVAGAVELRVNACMLV